MTQVLLARRAPVRRRQSVEIATGAAAALVLAASVVTGTWIVLVLLAIAVPVGVAVLQRPQRGLLLAAATIPYDGLLNVVQLPSITAGWKDGLLLTTVLSAVVHPDRRPLFGPRAAAMPPWWTTLLGFVAVGAVSAAVVGGAQGLFGLKVWFFWSLAAVVQRMTPFTAIDRDRLVTILMGSAVVTAAFGVIQQFLGVERLHDLGWEYDVDIRTTGSFLRSFSTFDGGPFPFAYFLATVLVVGTAVALDQPSRRRNQWFLVATPLIAAGLVCAFTRGAWVLAITGLGYLAVSRNRRLLLAVPLALSALVLVPPDVASSAFSSSSTVQRTGIWEQAIDVAVRYPVGVGIGSAGGASKRAARAEGLDAATAVETDNQYLLAFYEFGAPGLALLLLLYAGWVRSTRAAERRRGPDAALAAGVTGALLGAAAAFFFASLLQIFPFDAYLWLLLGAVHGAATDPVDP